MLPTKIRRLAVIVAVGAAAITGVILAAPAFPSNAVDAAPSTPTGRNITVTTITAQPLAVGATLIPNERVIIVVHDFGSRRPVTVQLRTGSTITSLPSATSTGSGDLHLVYQVPASMAPGRHVLTFVGDGPSTSAEPGSANVVATVPNFAEFPFTVGGAATQ